MPTVICSCNTPILTLLQPFSFFVISVHYCYFGCSSLLFCWRQEPYLGLLLSLLSSPVSCTGHMFCNICWMNEFPFYQKMNYREIKMFAQLYRDRIRICFLYFRVYLSLPPLGLIQYCLPKMVTSFTQSSVTDLQLLKKSHQK